MKTEQSKIIKYPIHNKAGETGYSPATIKSNRWVLHKQVKSETMENDDISMLMKRKSNNLSR